MKYLMMITIFVVLACEGNANLNQIDQQSENVEMRLQDIKKPECPKAHTDSIIPIVYGYPSEELFAKSDSGLVALGGCELADEQYYCKIHKISF